MYPNVGQDEMSTLDSARNDPAQTRADVPLYSLPVSFAFTHEQGTF